MEETIAQEAKRLLETIPEEEWIKDRYTDRHGKCCSLGHLNRLKSGDPKDYSMLNYWEENEVPSQKLRRASAIFIHTKHGESSDISYVNNTDSVNGYNEPSIKRRVMHLLNDMIEGGH